MDLLRFMRGWRAVWSRFSVRQDGGATTPSAGCAADGRGDGRRIKRIGALVLAVLAVYGVLGFFVAPAYLLTVAQQQLRAQLDRPVTIGRMTLNPYTLRLAAHHVRIGERDGKNAFIEVSQLMVQPSWASLLRGAPVLNALRLDAPRVRLIRYSGQRFNFSDLIDKFSTPAQPGSQPLRFALSNLQISDGRIDIDDRVTNARHVIDQWSLGIPFIATLPAHADTVVTPHLRARIDGNGIALHGRIKPFTPTYESEVAVKFDNLDVRQLLAYVPVKLPLTVRAGKLSSDLTVQFAQTAEAPALRVTGNVELRDSVFADQQNAPLFAARAVRVQANRLEPLRGAWRFDDIRVEQPVLHLARRPSGAWNVAALLGQDRGVPGQAAAPPLDLTIRRGHIEGGVIHFADQALPRPATFTLTRLAATLAGFSLRGGAPARYTLAAELPQGGALRMQGSASLAAQQADAVLKIDALPLPLMQFYLEPVIAARITAGTLGMAVNAHLDWAGPHVNAQLANSQLQLHALEIAAPAGPAPAIVLPQASAQLTRVDFAARVAEIARIDLNGLVLSAQRQRNGRFDLAGLTVSPSPAQKHSAPAWRYTIGELNVENASARYRDQMTPHPVTLAFAPLQLNVRQLSGETSKPLPIKLHTVLNRAGTLTASGTVTITPLQLALQIEAQRLDMTAFAPYWASAWQVPLAHARLDAKGNIMLALAEQGPRLSYRGDATLREVRLMDRVTSGLLARMHALALTNINARYDAQRTAIDVGRVMLSNFYGRVLLDAQRRLNLTSVIDASEPVPPQSTKPVSAAVTSPPASPVEPLRLHIGQIVLQRGRMTYTDQFVKPHFTANLLDINGTIGAFGTHSTQPAPVAVAAKLAANGPLSIRGMVNPLLAKPMVDLTAQARGVELTNLTSYSAKYAGYPIMKGKLNVDLHYQLAADRLTANNHLFIDQLTFGERVKNETATKLPVQLAIALLKNARGEININIPVSGSLTDPEFSIGGLIGRAFLNLLQKAVLSPFTLLANVFGGSTEALEYVEFAPGLARLSPASTGKLDKIAALLAEKPSIRVELKGRADPAQDVPGLREAYVERLIRWQKKIELEARDGASVVLADVQIEPAEYSRYLRSAYLASKFKKPRNVIGLRKHLPDEQMRRLLAEHAPIDEGSLLELAQRRVQSVQEYLDGKVDARRVFIVAPQLDTAGITGQGPTARVDFGLR